MLARNTGSAFSLFQAFTPFLAVVAIVVAVILVRAVRRTRDTLMVVALSLVLGGALGNLIDRLFRAPGFLRGAVVDFVHVGDFPTFNVADSAITIGAILIVIWAIRADVRERREERDARGHGRRWLSSSRCPRRWRGSGSTAPSRCSPAGPAARCRTWSRRARCWSTAHACRRAASSRPASVIELLGEPAVAGPARSPTPRSRSSCVTRTTTSSWWPSPPGLVVHPGAGHPDGTLVNGLLARYPEIAGVGDPARPGIVHRLDRDTSGLLVVARSPAAYDGLVEMLAAHDVERRYDALVWGVPDVAARRRSTRPSAARCGAPRAWPSARAAAAPAPRTRSSTPFREPDVALPRVPARDRPHPPDPGAPPGDRPPGGRRRRATAGSAPRSRSTARSSTPAGSRSPTRSPATRSRSRSRWRPSSSALLDRLVVTWS